MGKLSDALFPQSKKTSDAKPVTKIKNVWSTGKSTKKRKIEGKKPTQRKRQQRKDPMIWSYSMMKWSMPSFTRKEPFINVLECKCSDIQIRKDWNGHVGGNGLFMEALEGIAGVVSLRTLSPSPHPIFDFVKHLCDHFIRKETIGRTITVGHFCSMSDDVKVVYSMRDGA